MTKPVKTMKFEQALDHLEKVIESLEEGKLSLDDSIKAFEEGMGLAGHCEEKLAEAEAKVEILLKGKDGIKRARPVKESALSDGTESMNDE